MPGGDSGAQDDLLAGAIRVQQDQAQGIAGVEVPDLVMGQAMPAILDAVEIPWREIGADAIAESVAWARRTLDERPGPVALVVPPGLFA